MTSKTQRILALILMGIPGLVLIAGGLMKLINAEPEPVMQFLTRFGFGDSIALLGIGELLIAALLFYPQTHKIGFLLASCYFGGALCLEIAGKQPIASALFLILLWIGMFLRDKRMFLVSPETSH